MTVIRLLIVCPGSGSADEPFLRRITLSSVVTYVRRIRQITDVLRNLYRFYQLAMNINTTYIMCQHSFAMQKEARTVPCLLSILSVFVKVCSLAETGIEYLLADTECLRCNLKKFVCLDEVECLLK